MKRIKIFLITILSILLLVVLSSYSFANNYYNGDYTKLTLSNNGSIKMSIVKLYTAANMFCTEHGQEMGDDTYDLVASAHIDGKSVTLKYWNDASFNGGNGTPTRSKVINNSYESNFLAAIFNANNLKSDGYHYHSGTETYYPISGKQQCLWGYWNTWVNSLPNDWNKYFQSYSGNPGTVDKDKYNKNIATIKSMANQYEYSANIYYLKSNNYSEDYDGDPAKRWQHLILVDVPDTINISVAKDWNDDSNRDGKRPSSITVKLLADGKDTGKTLTLKANTATSKNWKGTFTGLTRGKNYTVQEVVPSGYKLTSNTGSASSGFKLTNYHEPEKTKIKIVKNWNDTDDLDEYRPTSVTFKLLANGKPAKDVNGKDVSTVVLNAPSEFSNTWECEVSNLYRYEGGKEITYTLEEVEPSGYTGNTNLTSGTDSNGMKVYTFTATNTHTPSYDGYIEIKGKVWEDKSDGKANAINGVYDDDENGLGGIKVTLRDANGKQFDATSYTKTANDGTYTIKVNYDNSTNVYKLYESEESARARLNTAYVEFEYDGMTYTTVKTAATGANTSKAIENETARNTFDNNHSTVNSSTTHPDKWTDKTITAITKNVISFKTYSDTENKKSTETLKYCNKDGTYIRTNPKGAWNAILTEKTDHSKHTSKNCPVMRTYDVDVEVINNVNLGLFKREQPDVAIYSDINKVDVTMNDQHYTYLYNVISKNFDQNDANYMRVKYQESDNIYSNPAVYNYKRELNPADIAYINQVDGDAMSVQITYDVVVGNLSTTVPITVHDIANYYDSRYELLTQGWNSSDGKGFKVATNAQDLNIRVEPGHESKAIQLTYNINVEAIRGLLNQDATLHNAVEILSYSTEYGENTLYAEQRTGGRTGKDYSGYDYNSHPGNAGIYVDKATYTDRDGVLYENVPILKETINEDDSFVAPSFILCKGKEKLLSGNVWEDSDFNSDDEYRIGDGKKTEGEQNLANAKVELYKVNDDGTVEQAKLYYTDGKEATPAVTYSDSEGNYTFGGDDYGVVTDRYFMKFTYGEGIDGATDSKINDFNVNARNYKSTIISAETLLYNLFEGTDSNDEWHLNISKGYSVAVDDIEKRVLIEDLQYDNFGNTIYMEAYSKEFAMQVEFDPSTEKTSQVAENGRTEFGNELSVFDFGVIERAREDIYTEKTIENVKVTLANGQILTQGNPNNSGELSYAKATGFNRFSNSADSRNEHYKRLIIEMDQELIQGAQLDITYSLKVTNDSEKEYDYYLGDTAEVCADPTKYDPTKVRTEFYYFGTYSSSDKLINSSINCLVDYVDTDLEYKWENADRWQEKTASELLDEGYISQKTHDAIANDYKAYITEQYAELAPGESSELEYAYASRVLANTEDNYSNTFENHMEILKIDAKTARTIKETGKIKLYKMGNYVPSIGERKINTDISNESAGLHEQDDDKVEVIVTPPTGEINNIITYTIVGLAGLLIISVGIIIIKKKVLTK